MLYPVSYNKVRVNSDRSNPFIVKITYDSSSFLGVYRKCLFKDAADLLHLPDGMGHCFFGAIYTITFWELTITW